MDILTHKEVITRKEHQCWGCLKKFTAKTKMHYSITVDEGCFTACYMCEKCQKYINENHSEFLDGVEYGLLEELND